VQLRPKVETLYCSQGSCNWACYELLRSQNFCVLRHIQSNPDKRLLCSKLYFESVVIVVVAVVVVVVVPVVVYNGEEEKKVGIVGISRKKRDGTLANEAM
jgi:hypothetical protein